MFTIQSYADVVTVAKTFGPAALDFAIQNRTINADAGYIVHGCKEWATSQDIELANVNDGNTEYTITAIFKAEKLLNDYETYIDNVTIIRTGFCSYELSLGDAILGHEITLSVVSGLLEEIRLRNEARTALSL